MDKKKQIEEMRKEVASIHRFFLEDDDYEILDDYIADMLFEKDYRKQSENVIELPCKVGDLVHFKGLETPWKVSAIHIYEEGQPQISITSETGKITSTMTANEFYMFCFVIDDAKMKGGAE